MLSNTAVPHYYAEFRNKVLRGEIPVCREISMEMNRIDALVADRNIWYDDEAVEGWIRYCEAELTLTDGEPLVLLDSFKLWGEQVFGWYYYTTRSVYVKDGDGPGGHFEQRRVLKRLIDKQYLIVARGAAKSMYASVIQNYFLNIDTSTTHQITTAPTMKLAEEVMSPIATAITRARGPLYKFLTAGSIMATSGRPADRKLLSPTKKGIQNFLTNSILEIRPMTIDKLQSLRPKVCTVDEWLSGDTREDVVEALEQGASKVEGWLIVATVLVLEEGAVGHRAPVPVDGVAHARRQLASSPVSAHRPVRARRAQLHGVNGQAGGPQRGGRALLALIAPQAHRRSEERRVGKECRSRWSPYH